MAYENYETSKIYHVKGKVVHIDAGDPVSFSNDAHLLEVYTDEPNWETMGITFKLPNGRFTKKYYLMPDFDADPVEIEEDEVTNVPEGEYYLRTFWLSHKVLKYFSATQAEHLYFSINLTKCLEWYATEDIPEEDLEEGDRFHTLDELSDPQTALVEGKVACFNQKVRTTEVRQLPILGGFTGEFDKIEVDPSAALAEMELLYSVVGEILEKYNEIKAGVGDVDYDDIELDDVCNVNYEDVVVRAKVLCDLKKELSEYFETEKLEADEAKIDDLTVSDIYFDGDTLSIRDGAQNPYVSMEKSPDRINVFKEVRMSDFLDMLENDIVNVGKYPSLETALDERYTKNESEDKFYQRDGSEALTDDLSMGGNDVTSPSNIKVIIGSSEVAEFRDTQFRLYQTLNFNNQDISNITSINGENFQDLVDELRALEGGIVYRGMLTDSTFTTEYIDNDKTPLNDFIQSEEGRAPRMGDMVKDYEGGEWYFGDTTWKYMGRVEIDLKAYALESDTMLLDGTNAMTNDMDLGGNDIVNVNEITPTNVLGIKGGVNFNGNTIEGVNQIIGQGLQFNGTLGIMLEVDGTTYSYLADNKVEFFKDIDMNNIYNINNVANMYTKAEVQQMVSNLASKNGWYEASISPDNENDYFEQGDVISMSKLEYEDNVYYNQVHVWFHNTSAGTCWEGKFIPAQMEIGKKYRTRIQATPARFAQLEKNNGEIEYKVVDDQGEAQSTPVVNLYMWGIKIGDILAKQNEEITVSVPTDYDTINEAIEDLTEKYYPTYVNEGFEVVIEIEEGFEVAERIIADGIDLSWITLRSVANGQEFDITSIDEGEEIESGTQSEITLTFEDFSDGYVVIGDDYFWTGTDPEISGKTGHEVTLGADDNETASNYQSEIDVLSDFTASVNDNVVTVTRDIEEHYDEYDFGGDMVLSVITEGEDPVYRARFEIGAHSIEVGDNVIIFGNRGEIEEENYNGLHEVVAVDTDWFEIADPYDEDKKVTLGGVRVAEYIKVDGDDLAEMDVWADFYRPFIGVKNGKGPCVDALFEFEYDTFTPDTSDSSDYYLDGICLTDSASINLAEVAGIIGCYGTAIYATRNSTINANDAVALNAGRHGVWAYAGSTINARRVVATDNGIIARDNEMGRIIDNTAFIDEISGANIIATRSSTINADACIATGAYSDNVHSEHGSNINVNFGEIFDSEVGRDLGVRYGATIATQDGMVTDTYTDKDGEVTIGKSHIYKDFPHKNLYDKDTEQNLFWRMTHDDGKVELEKALTKDDNAYHDGEKWWTYREIFEDGNLYLNSNFETDDDWQVASGTLNDGIVSIDEGNSSAFIYQVVSGDIDDRVYLSSTYKVLNDNLNSVIFHSLRWEPNSDNLGTTPNEIYTSSHIGTVTDDGDKQYRLRAYHDGDVIEDTPVFEMYNFYVIDLTIFTTEPTQQQMDEMLEKYLEMKENGYVIEKITIKE